MIFDTFTYNGESDLLDLRLHELSDLVDRWVICEATTTHAGNPKPLYFQESKHLFSEFLPRITHIIVDDLPPPLPDAWIAENDQRNQLFRGLKDAQPDDIVLVGDVDEIPDKAIIRQKLDFTRPYAFIMPTFYYYLNGVTGAVDRCTIVARRKHIFHPGPHASLRGRRGDFPAVNGGWHYSWCGDYEKILGKLTSFAHQELNTAANRDALADSVTPDADGNLKILFDRTRTFKPVPLAVCGGPQYLLDNPEKYAHLIGEVK